MTLGQRRFRWRVIVAAGILGGVVLCSLVLLIGQGLADGQAAPARATQEASWASLAALKGMCAGEAGDAAAAPYADGSGPHQLVVFRSNIVGSTDLSTFYNRSEDHPEDWRAALLEDAALVVCVQATSVVVEECAYQLRGGEQAVLQRVQLGAAVSVIAAQTGEVVAQDVLPGSEPRACGEQEEFADGVTAQVVSGDPVETTVITEWLRPYVE